MDGRKSGSEQPVASRQLVAMIVLIFLAINFTHTTAFEKVLNKAKIDGVDSHDLDIFIEKKIKYLHAKVDLKPAILGLMTLNKCAIQLSRGATDTLESTLSKALDKRVDRIRKRLYRITGKEHDNDRDKRSIEFIGDLISDIFGNPGPADWKQVNSNILALQGALKRVEENTEINHSDIDADRHVIEQHNKEIKSMSLIVNRNRNELVNISDQMKSLRTFFEISTLADTLDSLTLSLLEVKNDGMKGYCSDRVIDKEFLVENVQNMEANKIGISPIFGSWEWRNYYKYEMCTMALVKNALWITIRIPLVNRADRLVRVIPTFVIKKVIDRIELYGTRTVLFREKSNDRFHLMSQASFELCNVLGNTRTCGVRESRFSGQSLVVALEFMVDRFLIVSNKLSTIKITEKCPTSVNEVVLDLDSVIVTPPNCSYSAGELSILTRESDIEVTKEVGIMMVDKLEISKIENYHDNMSSLFIESIANRSSHHVFNKNSRVIKEQLDSIDTKHESSWKSYNMEKWIIVGIISFLVISFLAMKVRSSMVTKRVRSTTFNEIAELRSNLRLTQNEFRQETISLQELSMKRKRQTLDNVERAEDTSTSGEGGCLAENKTLSFSSPLNRSQFL
jgi:hypothetical protein